jgi:hypothetical protein
VGGSFIGTQGTAISTNSSGGADAIEGQSDSGAGIVGASGSGSGVYGVGHMGGNFSSSGTAQLFLAPAGSTGPPSSGLHNIGEEYIDNTGRPFFCTATSTPGTWATPLMAGLTNTPTATTILDTSASGLDAFHGVSSGFGTGVVGSSSG